MNDPEERRIGRDARWILGMLGVITIALVVGFTTRSPMEYERARARVILESVYRLQMAHRATSGTYFASDRGNTQEVLRLDDPPGPFRYRIERTYGGFVAYAEADFDGDGQAETWRVDATHPEPEQVRED